MDTFKRYTYIHTRAEPWAHSISSPSSHVFLQWYLLAFTSGAQLGATFWAKHHGGSDHVHSFLGTFRSSSSIEG